MQNRSQMQACGYDNACLRTHLNAIAAASPEASAWDDSFREHIRNGRYKTHEDLRQLFGNEADMRWAIGQYQYNEYLTEQCGAATAACNYKDIAQKAGLAVLDFVPIVGDVKGFADAINSGAPIDYAMAVAGIVPVGDLAKLGKLAKAGKLDGLTREQFDEMTAGLQLTKAERDRHYIDYVVNGGVYKSDGAIGFTKEAAKDTLSNTGRLDHASRHLIDAGLITGNSGSKAARQLFQDIGMNILMHPKKTFDHVMSRGGQKVKGFYGKVDGKDVVIFIAKDPAGKVKSGDIVTSAVPTPQQLQNWGLR